MLHRWTGPDRRDRGVRIAQFGQERGARPRVQLFQEPKVQRVLLELAHLAALAFVARLVVDVAEDDRLRRTDLLTGCQDIAVLDLPRVKDAATFFEPHRYAEGVVHVLVGGTPVVENGELTWALPGKIITPEEGRKPPYAPAATN